MYANIKYVILVAFILYVGFDLLMDIFLDADFEMDDLIDFVLVYIAGFFAFRELARYRQLAETVREEKEKNLILSGKLSELMQHRFDEWSLTSVEKATAWLIIRGFSIKEIAELRSVSAKTVQNHLTSIYAKSKTRNRVEFATSFIELLFEETLSEGVVIPSPAR